MPIQKKASQVQLSLQIGGFSLGNLFFLTKKRRPSFSLGDVRVNETILRLFLSDFGRDRAGTRQNGSIFICNDKTVVHVKKNKGKMNSSRKMTCVVGKQNCPGL